jgi:hypothetical protein
MKKLLCSWVQNALSCCSSFTLTLVVIGLFSVAASAQSIQGIVPVQTPVGGSGVEGDALAHYPVGTIYENVGDLFDLVHPTGTHGVLDFTTGQLLYPGFTFFLQDPFENDPTIFTLSNKINDNPNTYSWGAGNNPDKNEIQNAGAHFSFGDPALGGNADDLWVLFAGDRQTTNGSSYIDFEFLQKSLTITGAVYGPFNPQTGVSPIISGSGTFVSGGTQGGRTVGDVLVTIEFTQGGGDANAVIRVWTQISAGNYEYVVHPNSEFLEKSLSRTTTLSRTSLLTFMAVIQMVLVLAAIMRLTNGLKVQLTLQLCLAMTHVWTSKHYLSGQGHLEVQRNLN